MYKELSLGERQWICRGCGKLVLRDVKGAVNIKEFAPEKYFALMRLTGVERTEEPGEPAAMSRGGEPGKIGERAAPLSQATFFEGGSSLAQIQTWHSAKTHL